jgi:FkbM family methyltransferase
MRSFRSRAERSLTRWPALYAALLRRRPGHDFDRWLFLRLVRSGDTVFDVGANLGVYSLLFSRLVGRRGRVHAFEPGPPTFAALNNHLEREGPCRNLKANPLAVGAAAGTATLYLPGDDHGQASLSRQTAGSWTAAPEVAEFAVPMTTLDAYAAERNVARVDLIKIDVEGGELGVLQGAARLLARDHPLLHLEVSYGWARAFGYGPGEAVAFLAGLGYSAFYRLQGEVRLLRDPAAELADLSAGGSANLLCAIPGLHAKRLERILEGGQ